MMMRMMLATATALVLGITVVAAQSDLVEQRVKLMEKQAQNFGMLTKMARDEIPYDQAKVDEAFAALKQAAHGLVGLYPASAKGQAPDADYYASEKVWEDKADFDARLQDLIQQIDQNASKVKDVDTLNSARGAIGKVCGGCHETYRVKKS